MLSNKNKAVWQRPHFFTLCGDKFLNLFRPPLTPPKLGGVRGGLNNSITP